MFYEEFKERGMNSFGNVGKAAAGMISGMLATSITHPF